MPDQTVLRKALAEACVFAKTHGVEWTITPADFGIQRSAIGVTNAVYVDADHAVAVFIDRHDIVRFAVAELFWIHNESDDDREPCEDCGECPRCGEIEGACGCVPPRPMTTVYPPGDGPAVRDA